MRIWRLVLESSTDELSSFLILPPMIPSWDEEAICSSENLNSICQKFLPKFPYSTLQLQDSSIGPTKVSVQIAC